MRQEGQMDEAVRRGHCGLDRTGEPTVLQKRRSDRNKTLYARRTCATSNREPFCTPMPVTCALAGIWGMPPPGSGSPVPFPKRLEPPEPGRRVRGNAAIIGTSKRASRTKGHPMNHPKGCRPGGSRGGDGAPPSALLPRVWPWVSRRIFQPTNIEPVITAEAPGDPPDDETRLRVILDPDDPSKSVAIVPPASGSAPA